jgi:hypothetical protein
LASGGSIRPRAALGGPKGASIVDKKAKVPKKPKSAKKDKTK